MKKGKRKKSDTRRRGSTSQHPSSESTPPQHPSYDSAPQPPSSESTPPHASSDTNSQPTSSESCPQNPESNALPAPEISHPTQCLLPLDNSTKVASPSGKPGPLTHVGPHTCFCVPCPGSFACWRRLGQCHSRIFDVLMPRDWHLLPGRGIPSLLTFYRRSGRKHSVSRNSRAPSSRDRCCSSGSPGSCLLHH
ncbi:spermatogenesis-associated protein 3 [Elephas maximus indicus]|uniref:spermatogenesis-associated protein 3 n=1 Tax=Elephas maximus indicus TaxID=99487 RepID=UPI002116A380|nr:spermatogenesis-associated protein 3 [Elephas maximus indicus]